MIAGIFIGLGIGVAIVIAFGAYVVNTWDSGR